MNYPETLEFLFQQLPMYQRVGAAAYKANLDTTIKLDNYFGNPHKFYKTIHVAGTNGKGSVAHSLASILQEAGYKVGLYTSPHYLDFRERIRVNGQKVSENFVVDFVEKHNRFFSGLKPSFFEITVAMAFEYFKNQNVDIAVIEVGMGGRLDSTNILNPILSVITNISFDHTQFLGNDLVSIAKEKAEIIKKNVPVVVGEKRPNLKSVFSQKANTVDAPLYFAHHNYSVRNSFNDEYNNLIFNIDKHQEQKYKNLVLNLSGNYQKDNIIVILQAIEVLKKIIEVNDVSVLNGLKNIVKNTQIMGRWQLLSKNPKIICDAGHNEDGIFSVVNQLKELKYNKLHFVLGTLKDKNLSKILKILPPNAKYYFTNAKITRALSADKLQAKAINYYLIGEVFSDVASAIETAKENYSENDLIFIGGSTFVVAEAIEYFK